MKDKEEFFNILNGIDGKEFGEYNQLIGDFDFARFFLKITQMDADPEGKPALFVIRVPHTVAGFPLHLYSSPVRRTALEDLLTRKVAAQIEELARYNDEGISRRRIAVALPGQKILPRSSLVVAEEYVEARVAVDLPAREGRVLGEAAKEIFFEDLPVVVNNALIYCNLDEAEAAEFVALMEDADQIRQMLPTRGWVAFLAEGSVPSRAPGSDAPDPERSEPLGFPEGLLSDVEVPNLGTLRGLGVPVGITVILGDTYSGRVELMRAIAAGIYNHVPGDGRELMVSVPDAVQVAAEPGRSVQRVNVGAFLRRTPNATRPEEFTSAHADAYAAQAASTVEALEVGARVLLFDEAEAAPGFLSRDARLDSLLDHEAQTATPLSARARQMTEELGVSLVVAGSSSVSEWLPLADTVLRIQGSRLEDITGAAGKLGASISPPLVEPVDLSGLVESSRWVVPSSIDASVGRHDLHVRVVSPTVLEFGRSRLDLSSVGQLSDPSQVATIGLILHYAKLRYLDEGRPIREILDLIDRDLSTEGLECITRDLRGDLTRPRRYEIAAALNRLNTLRIAPPPE